MANVKQFDYPNKADDRQTLLSIQKLLNGTDWSADTIEDIAQTMREAGYEIADLDEIDDLPD
jgi:biotin operon repressor